MTNSPDDPWADLYKDLDLPVAEPAARPRDDSPEPPAGFGLDEPAAEEASVLGEGDDEGFADDEADDAAAIGEEEGAAAPGDDEGGPKKRRRRRRRRKKKPGTEGGDAAPAEVEADEPAEFEPADAGTDEDAGTEFTPELTRDLIANWNVPSWSEIVAGLYRPERG